MIANKIDITLITMHIIGRSKICFAKNGTIKKRYVSIVNKTDLFILRIRIQYIILFPKSNTPCFELFIFTLVENEVATPHRVENFQKKKFIVPILWQNQMATQQFEGIVTVDITNYTTL